MARVFLPHRPLFGPAFRPLSHYLSYQTPFRAAVGAACCSGGMMKPRRHFGENKVATRWLLGKTRSDLDKIRSDLVLAWWPGGASAFVVRRCRSVFHAACALTAQPFVSAVTPPRGSRPLVWAGHTIAPPHRHRAAGLFWGRERVATAQSLPKASAHTRRATLTQSPSGAAE